MSGYGRMPKLAAAVVATHAVPSSFVTGGSALYHWPGVLPVPACCRFAPIGMLGLERAPLADRSAEPAEPKEVQTLLRCKGLQRFCMAQPLTCAMYALQLSPHAPKEHHLRREQPAHSTPAAESAPES